ncbi:MAG: hypothetical protein ABF329_10870 [Lentimonas sp.]
MVKCFSRDHTADEAAECVERIVVTSSGIAGSKHECEGRRGFVNERVGVAVVVFEDRDEARPITFSTA